MPIYEYECDSCAIRFEKKQSFYDEPVASCPNCASKARRVICPAPIIFKGSGFYVTDSRKGSTVGAEPAKPEKEKKEPSGKEKGKEA